MPAYGYTQDDLREWSKTGRDPHATPQEQFAKDATGCVQTAKRGGQFYDCHGKAVTDEQAQDLLLAGQSIEVPNAGAGSYRAVLGRLCFTDCELAESTSSAGDWTIAAFDGAAWYAVFQSNRYPRHGFAYSIWSAGGWETKEELFDLLFHD